MTIDYANFTKLKAGHAFKPDKDFPARKYNGLEAFANVDDVRIKRAPKTTLEGSANALILDAERAEQAAIRANPPVFDKSYVERATYPLTELHADYAALIHSKYNDLTWADYRQERKAWRKCKHRFCLDYFPIDANFKGRRPKRSDAEFCCKKCKDAARDTELRFAKTGSYLPEEFYMPRQYFSVDDDIRAHEYAVTAAYLEAEINVNRPKRYHPLKNDKVEHNIVVFKTLDEAKAAYTPTENTRIIA